MLIVGREDGFRFFTGPPPIGPFDTDPYGNEGKGRVYGVEGLVKFQTEKTTGLIALTLSRSLRTGRMDDKETLFEYDQPGFDYFEYGQDRQYWAGHYGVKILNPTITAKIVPK